MHRKKRSFEDVDGGKKPFGVRKTQRDIRVKKLADFEYENDRGILKKELNSSSSKIFSGVGKNERNKDKEREPKTTKSVSEDVHEENQDDTDEGIMELHVNDRRKSNQQNVSTLEESKTADNFTSCKVKGSNRKASSSYSTRNMRRKQKTDGTAEEGRNRYKSGKRVTEGCKEDGEVSSKTAKCVKNEKGNSFTGSLKAVNKKVGVKGKDDAESVGGSNEEKSGKGACPSSEDNCRYVCDECDRMFKRKFSFKQHMILHKNPKVFSCPYEGCSRQFKEASTVRKHVNAVHLNIRNFLCEFCVARFKTSSALKNHIACLHPSKEDKQDFSCNVCGKTFSRKIGLQRHGSLHTSVKSFTCSFEGCGKSFRLKETLSKHENCVHKEVKPYQCIVCKEKFSRRVYLDTHMYKHTGIKNFSCDVCGKFFSQKGNLRMHMALHSKDRPIYKCTECSQAFNFKSNLTKHLQKHTERYAVKDRHGPRNDGKDVKMLTTKPKRKPDKKEEKVDEILVAHTAEPVRQNECVVLIVKNVKKPKVNYIGRKLPETASKSVSIRKVGDDGIDVSGPVIEQGQQSSVMLSIVDKTSLKLQTVTVQDCSDNSITGTEHIEKVDQSLEDEKLVEIKNNGEDTNDSVMNVGGNSPTGDGFLNTDSSATTVIEFPGDIHSLINSSSSNSASPLLEKQLVSSDIKNEEIELEEVCVVDVTDNTSKVQSNLNKQHVEIKNIQNTLDGTEYFSFEEFIVKETDDKGASDTNVKSFAAD